jgi:hypothetical protein
LTGERYGVARSSVASCRWNVLIESPPRTPGRLPAALRFRSTGAASTATHMAMRKTMVKRVAIT